MTTIDQDAVPPLRFADVRGSRLAYQDFGTGPTVVIANPPTAQSIEMAWDWPDVRAMLERFGSFSHSNGSAPDGDTRGPAPGSDLDRL